LGMNQTSPNSFFCGVFLRFLQHPSKSTTFELRSFAMCYAHFAYFVNYICKDDARHNLWTQTHVQTKYNNRLQIQVNSEKVQVLGDTIY